MNKKENKILISLIRKAYPKMMAKQITSVQPMTPGISNIFNMMDDSEWSKWYRTFSLWPRRSINSKIIFGRINKRERTSWEGTRHSMPMSANFRKIRIYEFATNKELFTAKLKGET